MLTTTDLLDDQVLSAINGEGGPGTAPLAAPKLGLIATRTQLTKQSVYADVQQPAFPGYALAAATFTTILRDSSNRLSAQSLPVFFQPTDATEPTTVVGYFITDTAGQQLLGWEYFAQPVPLRSQYDRLGVVAEVALGAPPSGIAQVIT